MGTTLSEEEVSAILALQPWVRARAPAEQFPLALRALLDQERCRKGAPEPTTGAFNVTYLTQGSLLKDEFDLSVHAHTGWTVGVLVCDVKAMIRVNQRYGFAAGDAYLREVATALREGFPSAKVVRIHTDAFAVLFAPSSDVDFGEALRTTARDVLGRRAAAFVAAQGGEPFEPGFTLALLALTVRNPSHWQLLGPLVWAEAERAHVLERSGKATGLQTRTLDLQGGV